MIYIGQYKGKQVYHEEPFVAKTCNQTCNLLQEVATDCGAKMDEVEE